MPASTMLRPGWKPVVAVAVLVLAAGCARGPVTATLEPYRGAPLEDLDKLTFDGEAFHVKGREPIARNEVQQVQFRAREQAGEAGQAAGAAQLSALARQLIPRGQALAQAYPGVPGVILVDDGLFTLNEDGTHRYRYHFAGLVLKEDAKTYAQLSMGFTEGRSRVRVLYARALNPGGAVTQLEESAMKIGSPLEEAAFFNPHRKVLSGMIPGVEVGSIVEYAYEYENYNPEDPRLFSPGYFFQGDAPVVLSRLEVLVPPDVPFRHVARNFPSEEAGRPAVEEQGGAVRYTWRLEDVAPVVSEPYMPPQHDVVPMVEASVFEDHDSVFALLAGLQQNRIALTPAIEAAVAEITAGAETAEAKLARIYHWVQENTRYISIKGSLGSGMSGHTAQQTFENGYGDCTDKAILFAAMCRAIGVESRPIIVMTNDFGRAVTEIPTLAGNHCISVVELDGRTFYLDTTAQNYRYPYLRPDDHGVAAMDAIAGKIGRVPVPPPEDNARRYDVTMRLTPEGALEVRTRNRYTGSIEAGIRGYWKSVRPDERAARMTDYVNAQAPGAVLDDFALSALEDLAAPLTMGIDYTLPEYAIRAKDLIYMTLPTLEKQFPEAALDTRQYPVQYYTTELLERTIALELPKRVRVMWAPPPLELDTPYVGYRARYEQSAGKLVLHERFERRKRLVPPEDYPEFRDALRAIAAFSKKELFFTEED